MTEHINMKVTADAKQAVVEVGKLNTVVEQTKKSAVEMGGAIDTAVRPTRNVGQAALEASRAFEDLQYGLGGVVNNIPSLVMSLGGTAGLTAVISLTAVGVNQLVKNFGGLDPAAKAAAEAAADHVKTLRNEIADLARDLRSLEVGAQRAAMEAQAAAVQAAAEAAGPLVEAAGGVARVRRLEGREDLPSKIVEDVKKASEALSLLDLEMSKLAGMRRIELEKDAQRRIDLAVDIANAEEKALQDTAAAQSKAYDKAQKERAANLKANTEALLSAGMDVLKEQDRERAATLKENVTYMHKAFQAQLDHEEAITALKRAELDARVDAEKKANEITEREREASAQAAVDRYVGITSALAVATGTLAAEALAGSEDALGNFLVAASQAAGGFVMLEGGKSLAEGIRGAANLDPRAPGQIATGLALVAGGAAIQAGGPAAVAALTGNAGGATSAAREPGASPRRDRSTGGGSDSLVVNVSYGVSGPLPEDTARAIAAAVGTSGRRGVA